MIKTGIHFHAYFRGRLSEKSNLTKIVPVLDNSFLVENSVSWTLVYVSVSQWKVSRYLTLWKCSFLVLQTVQFQLKWLVYGDRSKEDERERERGWVGS